MRFKLRFEYLALAFVVLGLACDGFGQTPGASSHPEWIPSSSADVQNLVLKAQHKLDAVEKQQAELNTELAKISQQVTAKNQELDTARKQAQSELDKANAAAMVGVDAALWKWDPEKLSYSAITPPAAPANASTQPAKPASASPGAATPPVQQAKK